jgi:hypothetical protein
MKVVIILAIVALMALVVISLVRGIVAFLKSTREDLERDPSAGPSAMQLKQGQMMFARVKFQLAAVIAIVVLAAVAKH